MAKKKRIGSVKPIAKRKESKKTFRKGFLSLAFIFATVLKYYKQINWLQWLQAMKLVLEIGKLIRSLLSCHNSYNKYAQIK